MRPVITCDWSLWATPIALRQLSREIRDYIFPIVSGDDVKPKSQASSKEDHGGHQDSALLRSEHWPIYYLETPGLTDWQHVIH